MPDYHIAQVLVDVGGRRAGRTVEPLECWRPRRVFRGVDLLPEQGEVVADRVEQGV